MSTAVMVPCSLCGMNTQSPTGICHRHLHTAAQRTRGAWGPAPSPTLNEFSYDAAARRTWFSEFMTNYHGEVSSDRARYLAVMDARRLGVQFIHQAMLESDDISAESRDAKLRSQFAHAFDNLPTDVVTAPDFSFNTLRGQPSELFEFRGLDATHSCDGAPFLESMALLDMEHALGREEGVTSPEGVNYAGVSSAEFRQWALTNVVEKEATIHARRVLARLPEFYDQTGHRTLKSVRPVAEDLVDRHGDAMSMGDLITPYMMAESRASEGELSASREQELVRSSQTYAQVQSAEQARRDEEARMQRKARRQALARNSKSLVKEMWNKAKEDNAKSKQHYREFVDEMERREMRKELHDIAKDARYRNNRRGWF